MKKLFEVEFRYESYTIITVEADNPVAELYCNDCRLDDASALGRTKS